MSRGSSFQLMQTLRKSPSVFRRCFRQDRTQTLSHGDPLFKVHYLGTEKIYSLDVEQAEEAIGRLLEKSPDMATLGKLGKEHALVVRPRYIEVKEISTGRQLTKTYLKDIAYCAADASRPNLFLYIFKQRGQQLQCRMFWCNRPDRAKDMTACLARSFQKALNELQEETSHTKGEDREKDGKPIAAMGHSKNSTLTADLRKGQWQRI
ncbi:uncharacterized protein LOC125267987 isoform X3 [Megalobrama amblycephala]|nr:uncharacterized protein LOC125267987 isoform X3 [Megalobrama amblycephala]XP_048046070.1 uncharacterized protein LOC125267987 isoform X3 [Megalobrama amblycephala]XP_048046071.1 uncharacterized protein LOC125267987 isoform X3 [Megalobrama amblycephala]